MKKAILLSGGIDSIALAYWFSREIELAITINYGQKSAIAEIDASSQVAKELSIEHKVLDIDCSVLGSGEMSIDQKKLSFAPVPEWWPFRNQLLITLASMEAVHNGVEALIIGSVKSDKSHIDGTKKFIKRINDLISMQEGNIQIIAPAANLSSSQLVKSSKVPESILYWAHSCHTGNYPCGECNGCYKYLKVLSRLRNSVIDNNEFGN
ncbi:7-cyano-7-deazaguanine synthase [Rufibacter glacialis]|uniref:7-cyano-7-deazaguanine synthase n=1 Tax=Rufibacter glacialis TaxID=1259555 RepID=A0A5M8QIC0_9BACT|nr:7-cyano-7-deazaguanine synthase [Rufibacter glacialis]KAA6434714.1 7-cyano-7-deazaguanine synthase [Rufibacter glacialis]GGK71833.1 7-cyano-7-deazaguanine synthase [Rufibacter glacialis]